MANNLVTANTSTISPTAPHPHSHLQSEPLYRCTTLFRARPDISEAQFYHHWYNIHGPLVAPWALHYNMITYTQYHTPSELRAALANGRDGGFKAQSPFEACADMYVKDYNDYMNAFKDPYYLEVISADEDAFVDKGQVEGSEAEEVGKVRAISTMGLCRSVVADGKILVDVPKDVMDRWEEYQRRKAEKNP